MKVLGISSEEQKAVWLILGAIYHLGAAGATKGNVPHPRVIVPALFLCSILSNCKAVHTMTDYSFLYCASDTFSFEHIYPNVRLTFIDIYYSCLWFPLCQND